MSCAPPRHSVTFSPVISTWIPSGMRAQRPVHLEEALHLVDDPVEVAGLVPGGRLVGVAVHRVALPDHLMAGGLHLLDDRRQQIPHFVVAQPADQRQPPRLVVRVQPLDVLDRQLRCHRRADLHADWVRDHLCERHVRAVELAGALPDPHIVRRQVVQPRLTRLILAEPQHRPLVVEHQRLVRCVDLGGLQVAVVDAARAHERQPAVDLTGQRLVTGTRRRRADELAVPVVHQVQRRQARRRERADQVHRRAGIRVGTHQARRIVFARGRIGGEPVDHVAAVGPKTECVDVRRSRLRVLTRDACDLDHRHARAVGQHHRHLQQRADVAADVRLGVVDERLGAVAALQQERLALRDIGQLAGQLLDFGRDRDRRHAFQHRAHRLRLVRRPAGLLGSRFGQGLVQPRAQIRGQRRQRRQLVDRDVDGPVHPSMVTSRGR